MRAPERNREEVLDPPDEAPLNPEDAPVSLVAAQSADQDTKADQGYMARFGRITFVLGILCLVAGLAVWMFRSGEHRSALLLLVVAMFLAILHNYSLEDGNGKSKA